MLILYPVFYAYGTVYVKIFENSWNFSTIPIIGYSRLLHQLILSSTLTAAKPKSDCEEFTWI